MPAEKSAMLFVLPLKCEREDRCCAGGTLAIVPVAASLHWPTGYLPAFPGIRGVSVLRSLVEI